MHVFTPRLAALLALLLATTACDGDDGSQSYAQGPNAADSSGVDSVASADTNTGSTDMLGTDLGGGSEPETDTTGGADMASQPDVVTPVDDVATASDVATVEDASTVEDVATAEDVAKADDAGSPDAGSPDAGSPDAGASDDVTAPDAAVEDTGASPVPVFQSVSAGDLALWLEQKDFLLLNVHIPYAGQIPGTDAHVAYTDLDGLVTALGEDKGKTAVLYCLTGPMSTKAVKDLMAKGYYGLWSLEGGMKAWKALGYPIEGADW